jgi:AcrR family transcriptional regulator
VTAKETADSGGMRLRADARRNRARVLEVAEEVFATNGMSAQIDEIARRAGVGVGTIYRSFPTKEALFEAVVTHGLEQLTEQVRILAAADDPGAAFYDCLDAMSAGSATHQGMFDALTGAGIDMQSRVAGISEELMDAFGALLLRAQQAGAVRTDVNVADVKALLIGAHSADQTGGATQRVIAVIRDGLRPDRHR